jgi:diadenosine tetraphosphate (Ap4A) HIT family hydrolase
VRSSRQRKTNAMHAASSWELHPQLAAETVPVGDLPLCRVLLSNDANYPWLVLVPRLSGLVDIIDLQQADRAQLMEEAAQAAAALRRITDCHKLNVAALGNAVPQLHVHVIARFRTDAAWPRPVWGQVPALAYADEAQSKLVDAVRAELDL